MGALNAVVAAALLAGAPVAQDPVVRWEPIIAEASRRFGIPADWIRRVMRAESGGRTARDGRPIVSRAGAMGLMQIMPTTWTALRAQLRLGGDPQEPRDNILAGAFYLRQLHDRFGYPGLFAAYNAGPGRYARVLAGRSRLPAETSSYVRIVAGYRTPIPRPPVTVAQRRTDAAPARHVSAVSSERTLFVRLTTTSQAQPRPVF